MNCVHLIGRVQTEPELRHTTGNGQAVLNLILVTYDDRGEERHRLVFWGERAVLASERVHKDDTLGVEGKLQSRRWTDDKNQGHLTTEVMVTRIHFLEA